ncbi:interferon-induced very large GTPase 1-like [Apostichopus japonicus]|uniref:interferon-induced very large GTPase 1-like n=1 Tax=Stichopus japonicus TaxID=307972 RepID=UPI003AB441D0
MGTPVPSATNSFKLSLRDYLTKEICDKLCTYFNYKPGVKERIAESKNPGGEFLDEFEDVQGLDANKVKELIKALRVGGCGLAASKADEYSLQFELSPISSDDDWELPEDDETDDDITKEDGSELTFRELLTEIGLKDSFPSRLSLKQLVKIKNPSFLQDNYNLLELFWQKLGSLDYRVRSNKYLTLRSDTSSSRQISVRDLIFAILQCSDSFLRQDIIEKLSACNLAVPVILQGVANTKPRFMLWSLGRIVKKWKGSSPIALEQYISNVPLFTVSFLRIGDLKDVSKSIILNHLLGPCQGNDTHPFFLTNEDDHVDPVFSKGSVEGVWYLPMNANGSEHFKWVTSFLNLRGNGIDFPIQTEFVCKASDLTVVLLDEESRKLYKKDIKRINNAAKKCYFVVFHPNSASKPPARKQKLFEYCLHVRQVDMGRLSEEISTWIEQCHEQCKQDNLQSFQHWQNFCVGDIEIEDMGKEYDNAKQFVETVFGEEQTENLLEFKEKAFPLQEKWREWVDIDKESLTYYNTKKQSIAVSRDERKMRKDVKRQEQLACGLSKITQSFLDVLVKAGENEKVMRYFVFFLQDKLFHLVDDSIKKHFVNIDKYQKEIQTLDKLINSKSSAEDKRIATIKGAKDDTHNEIQDRYKRKRTELKTLSQTEVESSRAKNIGWEHFLRELGQWHEAHTELKIDTNEKVGLVPRLAAKLLLEGHSIEIMDGDTDRVPLSWITSVLVQLTLDLDDPKVVVISVVGVQSSGKSTLLNSMFGVKFPVRAGRCTRGLFMRMLHLDDTYASQLGFRHIFLVDSEGVRSIERKDECRFDNELVTLTLCISDITILNIEGENIGPEMTGLLEIAAHAFMRMKEVDLHSQCRIIQQRVSDLTASRQNKINMDIVTETLNEATVQAARKEGLGGKYQQFSDVFDLRINEDLQYIPCLWTGPMSPPCQFYSELVLKLKADILNDISSGKVIPHFTLSTFIQRIRDVWVAVKGENFLFNFQDSIKAIDSDDLSMELNKQITTLRANMGRKLIAWQNKLLSSSEESSKVLQNIEKELVEELQKEKDKINTSFEMYISQHERQDSLRRHADWYSENVGCTVDQVQEEVMVILKHEVNIMQIQRDITTFTFEVRTKIAAVVKSKAIVVGKGSDPMVFFNAKWDEWKAEIIKDIPKFEMTEENIEKICESLLVSITSKMAIFKEITELLHTSSIKKHAEPVQWKQYYSHKYESLTGDDWFSSNENILQNIITSSEKMMEESPHKSLNANLIQYIIRSALQSISSPNVTSDPPHRLKAKLLLHICGKIFNIAVKEQIQNEKENSLERRLEEEKSALYTYFVALIENENPIDRVVECIRKYLHEWGKDLVLTNVCHVGMLLLIDGSLANTRVTYKNICSELSGQQNVNEYLKFIETHPRYRRTWVMNKFVKLIRQKEKVSVLQRSVKEFLSGVTKDLCELVQNSTSTHESSEKAFKRCFDDVLRGLMNGGFKWHRELATEVQSFKVMDVQKFYVTLQTFLKKSQWRDDIIRETKALEYPSEEEVIAKFVRDNLSSNINDLLTACCLEQCPMCKAPCDNALPLLTPHEHFSFSHLPRGISGATNPDTFQLLTETCVESVVSDTATYFYPCDKRPRLCKNYKKDYPTWAINRGSGELLPNMSAYWKWVMVQFNDELAQHYKCEPATIPPGWKGISKEMAIASLKVPRRNIFRLNPHLP